MRISDYTTKELVQELENREGVEMTCAGPDEYINIKVDGPAQVLIVID